MMEIGARLHIVLGETEPPIERRIEFPITGTLQMLHNTIQAAMGWENRHLWEFEVGRKRYGEPDPNYLAENLFWARNIKLKSIIERGINQFVYVYDFGDNWRHWISIESVTDGSSKRDFPRFIEGNRNAPPEDVGGSPGFAYFLEAISDPRHPDYSEKLEWYDHFYDGEYNSHVFDEVAVRRRMNAIVKRRTNGRAT